MKEKFLMVLAVLDEETQEKLKRLQNKIIFECESKGLQTINIPFHISLGSFPLADKDILQSKIKQVSKSFDMFDIVLDKIGWFGDKVVFAEPIVSEKLADLQKLFDNNYADDFSWHAHTTLFIDNEENVVKAKNIAIESFSSINAKVVGLSLYEFFPTKLIEEKQLNFK